jgi:hypothetical protein
MSDDKYWSDYSFFIKRTEELTRYGPSSLLEFYGDFVTELQEGVGVGFEESMDDDVEPFDFIRLSYVVIDDEKLRTNVLKEEFEQNVKRIEERLKQFLFPHVNDVDWQRNLKTEYVDWSKAKRND